MTISTWTGLSTALRGLLAQQRGLDVAGHNIANVNTPGYSRQEVLLAQAPGLELHGAGIVGQGVDVVAFQRIRADYLDVQLRSETMKRGQADALAEGLDRIELALAEPSDDGINALLSRYFASWQDLAGAPESTGARQVVVQSALALADALRALDGQLEAIATGTGPQVAALFMDVDSIAARIGELNEAIVATKAIGLQPNDMLDQRDALVDRLSELVNTSVSVDAGGGMVVTVGGTQLVAADGTVANPPLAEGDLATISSGRLAGLIELRDSAVPAYRAQLDALVGALVSHTNAVHAAGFDLAGNAGGAFFTGTNAATIGVAAGIVASPGTIAASGTGAPGDASQALAIAGSRLTALVGGATLHDAYSQLVTRVGSDSRQALSAFTTAKIRTEALEERRQSVSGVSLDEEMTNLIRFQRGFQASSRVMSAVDEMLDILVNRTGRVGL